MRRHLPRIALCVLAVWLLGSCASSSGSTYQAGAADESAAAAASARAKAQEEARKKAAANQASPPPATSTGGGLFGAVLLQPPPPPPPPKGHLLVGGLVAGSSLSVDGQLSFFAGGIGLDQLLDLDPGYHEVLVRRFGYEDWREGFSIAEGETLRLEPVFLPAPFALRSFEIRPRVFNPADPGFYGRALLSLEAVAAGNLELLLLDAGGAKLLDRRDIGVERSFWSWSWDGRDGRGWLLPPGRYRFLALDAGGGELGRAEFRIDDGLRARSALLASGSGGPLFVPSARGAAPGGLELGSFVLGHVLSSSGPPTGRLLSGIGTRLGIEAGGEGPERTYELDLSALGIFHPGETGPLSTDAYVASLSFLAPLSSGPLLSSLLIKASYGSFLEAGDWPSPYDGLARYPGLSLSLPLEYDADSLRGFLAPELALGRFYPGYDPAQVPGFHSWAYLRAGFESSFGPFSLALSGALRSLPLEEGLGLSWPLPAGLELRWHGAETPLVLSFILTGEFDSRAAWYLNSGLGLGYRL